MTLTDDELAGRIRAAYAGETLRVPLATVTKWRYRWIVPLSALIVGAVTVGTVSSVPASEESSCVQTYAKRVGPAEPQPILTTGPAQLLVGDSGALVCVPGSELTRPIPGGLSAGQYELSMVDKFSPSLLVGRLPEGADKIEIRRQNGVRPRTSIGAGWFLAYSENADLFGAWLRATGPAVDVSDVSASSGTFADQNEAADHCVRASEAQVLAQLQTGGFEVTAARDGSGIYFCQWSYLGRGGGGTSHEPGNQLSAHRIEVTLEVGYLMAGVVPDGTTRVDIERHSGVRQTAQVVRNGVYLATWPDPDPWRRVTAQTPTGPVTITNPN